MARTYGKLFIRAWGDPDFRSLTGAAQALYQQLISQPDMSLAGVVTTAPERWAGQSSDGSAQRTAAALNELEDRRYIVRDPSTMETLVRSFVRNDLMWRSPKSMMGIDSSIRSVLSNKLKEEIAKELARCDTTDLSEKVSDQTGRSTREVVEGLINGLTRDFPAPAPSPSAPALDTPSEGVSDGVSQGVSRVWPTETTTEPEPEPATTTGIQDAPSRGEFDQWWEHWPRKKAVGDARKAFPAARKHATLHELTTGADAYFAWCARNNVEDRYVVSPGPWLRQERWKDDLVDRNPPRPPRGQTQPVGIHSQMDALKFYEGT